MSTFVGAEYVIGNLLVAEKNTHNKESITLGEAKKACEMMQIPLGNNEFDKETGVYMYKSYNIEHVLWNNQEYFKYDKDAGTISAADGKAILDIDRKFKRNTQVHIVRAIEAVVDKIMSDNK